MLYDYTCKKCQRTIEINHPMKEYGRPLLCNACGSLMAVSITGGNGFAYKRNEWPEYNPAFGRIVKSSYERKELSKAHGLVEIGTENIEKLGNQMEKDKLDRQNREWNDL